MFLYENLLASCNKKDSCGRLKGRWYEAEMVSPLDENCEKRLTEKALSGTERCTHIPTLLIIN